MSVFELFLIVSNFGKGGSVKIYFLRNFTFTDTYPAWNATLWLNASETSPESCMYCYPEKHRLCLLSVMLTKLFPEGYRQQQGSRYQGTGKRGGPCYTVTTRLIHIQMGQSVTPLCHFLNNNNKVFIKRTILSLGTILSIHAHTQAVLF